MQRLRKQPLLSTAMKLGLRFGYRRKAGNPALSMALTWGMHGCKRGPGGCQQGRQSHSWWENNTH